MKRKPTLTIYRNRAGRYNWTLKASNGEPLAKGCGEKANGFASARSAWRNAKKTADALGWIDTTDPSDVKLPVPGGSYTVGLPSAPPALPYARSHGLRITREAE